MATEKIEKVLANMAQGLTSTEQAQARDNIGLADVAHTGSYNDLTDKPELPGGQVNADWDATSGISEILNKPNLATVATSGSYNDLTDKPQLLPEATSSDLYKVLTVTDSSGGVSWYPSSEVRVKERNSGGLVYTRLTQFTLGTSMSELYGVKEGTSTNEMLGLFGPYPSSTDDGKFLRCTWGPGNNCWASWENPEPLCDLKILEPQTVTYSSNGAHTLTVANEYSYKLTLDDPGSHVVTLNTNSTDTLHTIISVKTSNTSLCSYFELAWYDEALDQHSLTVNMTETNKTFYFDVYVRKVYTQSSSYTIARVHDFPCGYRESPFTSGTLDNNTNWIGRW